MHVRTFDGGHELLTNVFGTDRGVSRCWASKLLRRVVPGAMFGPAQEPGTRK